GFALGLVRRVEVRRVRDELRGARVDARVDGAERARGADLLGLLPGELRDLRVREPEPLPAPELVGPELALRDERLGVDDAPELREEPGIDARERVALVVADAGAHRVREIEEALGRR